MYIQSELAVYSTSKKSNKKRSNDFFFGFIQNFHSSQKKKRFTKIISYYIENVSESSVTCICINKSIHSNRSSSEDTLRMYFAVVLHIICFFFSVTWNAQGLTISFLATTEFVNKIEAKGEFL